MQPRVQREIEYHFIYLSSSLVPSGLVPLNSMPLRILNVSHAASLTPSLNFDNASPYELVTDLMRLVLLHPRSI